MGGREGSSLLVHTHYHTLASLLSIFFLSDFYVISFFSYLLLLFLLAFLCFISRDCLSFYYVKPRPFYTAYRDGFYCFTPQLLLSWCRCPSQTTRWFVSCLAITTSLCWPCHVPFPDKRVFSCFLALRGIPIWIRVGHSL